MCTVINVYDYIFAKRISSVKFVKIILQNYHLYVVVKSFQATDSTHRRTDTK